MATPTQRAKYAPPPSEQDDCHCTMRTAFMKWGKVTHQFPYFDETGVRQFSRFRYLITEEGHSAGPKGDKTFRYCEHYDRKNAAHVNLVYGLPRLLEAVEESKAAPKPELGPALYLVEGEKDAEAIWEYGDAYATTTHLGVNFYTDTAEHFKGFRGIIYIVVDRDHLDPKHIAKFEHEDESKRRDYPGSANALRKFRALKAADPGLTIRFREAKVRGAKDAYDHLTMGGTLATFRVVQPSKIGERAPFLKANRKAGGKAFLASGDRPEGPGLKRLVEALEASGYDIEKIGPTRYKTNCPHPDHDDSNPSFEFDQGELGAMMTCESTQDMRNSCNENKEAICKAIGITLAHTFDDWKGGKGGRPAGTRKIKLDANQELQQDDETYPAFHPAFEGHIGTTRDNEPNDKGNGKRMQDLYGKVFRYTYTGKGNDWMVWNGTHWSTDHANLINRATADLTSYMESVEVWHYVPEDAPAFPEDWSVVTQGGTKYKALLGKNGALNRSPMETVAWVGRSADRSDWFGERLVSEQSSILYQATLEWIEKCKDGARMREAAKQLQHQPGISVTLDEFNNVRNTLACLNGQLNTITCELEPHRLEDMNTRIAPVVYNPKAQAPIWNAYLEKNQPDPQTRRYLQKLAGYAISGDGNQKLIAFMFSKIGDTGKSIFTNTIEAALGKGGYADTLADGVLSKRRFDNGGRDPDRDAIRGKRLVVAMELAPNEPMDERFVKQLTGGDGVSTRGNFARDGNTRWQPECLVVVATNHLSRINAEDEAVWNRIQVVPWGVAFPKGHPERDEDLLDKLTGNPVKGYEGELPGVLAWMVEGLRLYRAEGLVPPPEVVEASMVYRSDADVVQTWLLHAAEEGDIEVGEDSKEERYVAQITPLHKLFEAWAKQDKARDTPGIRAFSTRLGELGYTKDPKYRREPLKGLAVHIGLRIPEEAFIKFNLDKK